MTTTKDILTGVLDDVRRGSLRDEWAAWLAFADALEEGGGTLRGEGLYGESDRTAPAEEVAAAIRSAVAAEQAATRAAGGRRQKSRLYVNVGPDGEGPQGFGIDGQHVRWVV
jgi:hypothetical protein